MTRIQNRLTLKKVRSDLTPGRYTDGNCLHLVVHPSGSRNWVVRTIVKGKRRDIGIGGFPTVSLSSARAARDEIVQSARTGGDPILDRKRVKSMPTFIDATQQVIAERVSTWRNEKHAKQWLATLETYCFPTIGTLKVSDISVADVRGCLEPIWVSKHDTATKVLQRCRIIFSWAIGNGYRETANPCEGLRETLPRIKQNTIHRPALPWRDLPSLMKRLATDQNVSSLALRLVILTASRTNEVRFARWDEVDDDLWVIPGHRMKAAREHIVPVTMEMRAVIEQARGLDAELIFPGQRRGKPMSDMTVLKRLRQHAGHDVTVHGFRSTFRDWADEFHKGDGTVAEACLAHVKGDKVVQAYARSTLLERRRDLLEAWNQFAVSEC